MTTAKRTFRLHVSTYVVVLALAGVLLFLNFQGRLSTEKVAADYCTVVKQGWPQTFLYSVYHRQGHYSGVTWFYGSLAKNMALAGFILLIEAAAWEWLIRLRDKTSIPERQPLG